MTTREKLHQIVESLREDEVAELLDYAEWLLQEGETLTEEEIARVRAGEDEIERGERVAWDELRRELDV